jgi:hypothetical protein
MTQRPQRPQMTQMTQMIYRTCGPAPKTFWIS